MRLLWSYKIVGLQLSTRKEGTVAGLCGSASENVLASQWQHRCHPAACAMSLKPFTLEWDNVPSVER